MSIIIVGVGQEDFSAMEALDADRKGLSSQGQVTPILILGVHLPPPPLLERM
jgi:hypothetical protein